MLSESGNSCPPETLIFSFFPFGSPCPKPQLDTLSSISGFLPSFSRLVTQLRCCPDFWALSFPETSPCLRIWKSTSKRNQPSTMACTSRCLPGLRHYKCPCLKQQKNYWKRSASLLEFPEWIKGENKTRIRAQVWERLIIHKAAQWKSMN